MPRSRSNNRPLALALLLAVVVVSVGGSSAYRKVRSFQPIGFEARPAAGHWLVEGEPHAATGLAPGDQLLLVNGQGVSTLESLAEGLRGRPASELVVVRDAEVVTLDYRLPPLEIDFTYLILGLIGLVYLLIGFYTLMRNRRRPALLFYAWCLTSAVVYLVAAEPPFDLFGKSAYLLDALAHILVAPLTLHLFTIFPRPLARSRRLAKLIPFFYLPAAFLLTLQADLIFFDGALVLGGANAATLQALDRLELVHLGAFALAAAILLAWRLRGDDAAESHRQAVWVAVGMAGGYVPFLALYALPYSLGFVLPRPISALAVLPLALVPLTFAYAILRYKLWDIGSIVRGAISLSMTVMIGAFGFALANLTVSRLVPEQALLGRNLVTFLSGLMIAGLLVPTHRGLSNSLERVQYRGAFRRRRALVEFGRELLEERNLERLTSALARRLEESLDLRRINLLLVQGGSLLPVQPESRLPDFLPFEAFDRDFWETEVESLDSAELPGDRPSAGRRLWESGYRYAFPLRVRGAAIGIVVTGYRHDDIPLSSDDLDLIRGLLDQAALAIENAQLLTEVRRQLDEVSRLQQFSQGIIESSPAGIAVLDEDGRIVAANLSFANLVDTSVRGVRGARLRDVLPIEPLPEPNQGFREFSFRRSADDERYLQVGVAPFQLADSEAQRVLVVQDVSERVRMENELKEKDRLASLGMLAAGVAHEVNTPITGISSYAQMLLSDTPEDDPRYELLKKVEKQTFRAAQIVSNLLEFARNRNPEQSKVRVTPVVSECLEMIAERMADQGVELAWRPPDEETVVLANEGELLQVFTNLTTNALDAMDDGGGRLTVEIECDRRWVWVTVADSGPGIAPEELNKIFQPFFSSKLGSGGTGLGLAITYSIVRRHGGDIRVISHPGEGCRFVVELPRQESPKALEA